MTSFSLIRNQALEQGQVIVAVNSISEIKVKKERLLMFVMDWNLAKYVRKSYYTRKCKKNEYQ